MRHALVVGGTGMLWGVCEWLAGEGWGVSVVSRSLRPRPGKTAKQQISKAANGEERRAGEIWPVLVDYRDGAALERELRGAVAARRPVELAVCWIHDDAPAALEIVVGVMARERESARMFHVVGSSAADPSAQRRPGVRGVRYRRVVLGFVVEAGRSRWLSNGEIADGVIDAIGRDEQERVVGVVRPRGMRPRD